MADKRSERLAGTDWGVLSAVFLLAAAGVCVLDRFTGDLAENFVTVALTNTAMVGGVVAGLSLAGLSALTLSSAGIRHLMDRFGGHVRGILLGSYAFATVLALASGLLAAMPATWLAQKAVAVLPPLLTAILLAATYFVTALYRLGDTKVQPEPTRKPLPPGYAEVALAPQVRSVTSLGDQGEDRLEE